MGQSNEERFSFQAEIDRRRSFLEDVASELENIREKLGGTTIECESGASCNCLEQSAIGGSRPLSQCEQDEVPALMWSTHYEDSTEKRPYTVCWGCALVLRDKMGVRAIPARRAFGNRGYRLEMKMRSLNAEIAELERKAVRQAKASKKATSMFVNKRTEALSDGDENRTRAPVEDLLTEARERAKGTKTSKKGRGGGKTGKTGETNGITADTHTICTSKIRGVEKLATLAEA